MAVLFADAIYSALREDLQFGRCEVNKVDDDIIVVAVRFEYKAAMRHRDDISESIRAS